MRGKFGRVLMVVPALLVTALILTACSVSSRAETYEDGVYYNDSSLHENKIELSDGREITCIAMVMDGPGGLSCDWGSASNYSE